MHARDPQPVTGHADEPGQPFVAGCDHRLDRSAGAERRLPLVGLDQVVQLDQIDLVDAHPFEGRLQFGARGSTRALPGLRGEEESVAVLGEEGGQPEFRIAVAGGGVDVVDPGIVDRRERRVGPFLAHCAERRGTEDDTSGGMAGPAEQHGGDHGPHRSRPTFSRNVSFLTLTAQKLRRIAGPAVKF